MNEYIKLLQSIDLFKNISYEEILDFFTPNLYIVKNYKKGSIIFLKNEECKTCNILLKGNVVIQDVDINGNVLTLNKFSSGDIFGDNLLFSSSNNYPMNIFSYTDTTVIHLKKELIFNLCKKDSVFLENFLMSVSDKTIILKDKVKKLSIKSIRECIVDYLLYQYKCQNNLTIKLDRSKKELAEEFGIQRTSFSRELNKMKKDGLIDFDNKCIEIIDLDLLLEIYNN
ncbi:Crp/Fnr family transcriptional regulator [Romboutsia sp.]|uniref:Crp/Fnr family transcriptional regulator n=1 Tax=Romboutsia sp. TaxID=1965302 RepID=UPI003F36525D